MLKRIIVLQLIVLISCAVSSQRIMENLNRGLVAVRTSSDRVFLSWRLLGSDVGTTAFHLYRDGIKITSEPITGATNYTDQSTTATQYTVKTVVNGTETGESHSASILSTNFIEIPLQVPAGLTMPDGSSCTYSPNDASTGDLDGDGNLDIVLKWDPSNAKDNSQGGYTGNVYLDGYKLDGTFLFRIDLGINIRAGAHYTQFQVADYDGDGKAEIVCKTAPGTKDGKGNFLSKGPAATTNHNANYRTTNGYILSGPEYLTVFSGLTGEELATVNYNPARGSVSSWGDNYGNRVDRFLAGTAWLDGVLPSIIMCRGYYTRAVIAAWNFRNGTLTPVWTYNSGTTSGVGLYGQGNHNMSIGDVDEDGFDEIIWGAGAVDHDGKLMYRTGLGHGDAMHLTDLDPDRKGLEVWTVHESSSAAYGEEMHDARTGAIIWGNYTGGDNGRGMAANIIPGNRGFEMWSTAPGGVKDVKGVTVNSSRPSINFRIYWDGDAEDELLDGTSITKYLQGTLLSASGCSSINGTKSTPNLSADLVGDWREEVIFRTSDNKKLRVYTTTIPTNVRMYTLMHDPVYRASIAWQNTAYNQPPHAGFYIGSDMDTPPASPVYKGEKRWNNGTVWDAGSTSSWKNAANQPAPFQQNDAVLFDHTTTKNAALTLTGTLSPSDISVNSPFSVEWNGDGTVTGITDLKKNGKGTLTLQQNNSYSGTTSVWNGSLINNGYLANSKVHIYSFSTLGGKGRFGKAVQLGHLSTLDPGSQSGSISTMRFDEQLQSTGTVNYLFDILISGNKVIAHDTLIISGDWNFSTQTTFQLRTGTTTLVPGNYPFVQCNGKVTGELSKIIIKGIPSYLSYSLVNQNGIIILKVTAPAILTWTGAVDSKWDNGISKNWKFDDQTRGFSGNDSVLFNDESSVRAILVNELVNPAHTFVEADGNYTIYGNGSIAGTGGLTKKGDGRLTVTSTNSFTGRLIIEGGSIETNTLTNGGVASPLGAAAKTTSNIILNGGKLTYSGSTTTTDRAITLGANGGSLAISNTSTVLSVGQISGTGRLTKEGSGRLAFSAANTYTGGTTISGGTIVLTNDVANIAGLGLADTITLRGGSISMFNSTTTNNNSTWNLKIPLGFTGTLMVDGRSIIGGSITGAGTLNYFTPFTANVLTSDASSFRGTINVTTDADGGNFLVHNEKGYEGARINLSNNVTMMYPATATITIPIGELSGQSRAILGAGGTAPCTITWEIGARNTNSTFNGIINNTQYSGTGALAAIRKTGTGTLTLTNDNTYSGTTVITSGELMINNIAGSGTGSGKVTVMTDSRLSGTGSIGGTVVVEEGGELSPGNTIGTLTLQQGAILSAGSFLVIDIDEVTGVHDQLIVADTLTMNGILQFNTSETKVFKSGDQLKIVSGKLRGIPTDIRPATPGDGLEWDLSTFESDGTVRVITATGLQEFRNEIQMYPNPVRDVLNVQLSQPQASVRLQVYSIAGSLMLTEEFTGATTLQLSTASLAAGTYLLKVTTTDYSVTTTLVKHDK